MSFEYTVWQQFQLYFFSKHEIQSNSPRSGKSVLSSVRTNPLICTTRRTFCIKHESFLWLNSDKKGTLVVCESAKTVWIWAGLQFPSRPAGNHKGSTYAPYKRYDFRRYLVGKCRQTQVRRVFTLLKTTNDKIVRHTEQSLISYGTSRTPFKKTFKTNGPCVTLGIVRSARLEGPVIVFQIGFWFDKT